MTSQSLCCPGEVVSLTAENPVLDIPLLVPPDCGENRGPDATLSRVLEQNIWSPVSCSAGMDHDIGSFTDLGTTTDDVMEGWGGIDVGRDDIRSGRLMRTVNGSSSAESSPNGAGRWLYFSAIESSRIEEPPDLL